MFKTSQRKISKIHTVDGKAPIVMVIKPRTTNLIWSKALTPPNNNFCPIFRTYLKGNVLYNHCSTLNCDVQYLTMLHECHFAHAI